MKRVPILLLIVAAVCGAQSFEAGARAGATRLFLDEPLQPTAGGFLRLYVTRRVSVEPEALYTPGSRFSEWSFAGRVAYDLRDRDKRIRPYVAGGLGFYRCLDKAIDYTATNDTVYGAVGVRLHLNERWFVSPEFRLGGRAWPQVSAGIGYMFSTRRE